MYICHVFHYESPSDHDQQRELQEYPHPSQKHTSCSKSVEDTLGMLLLCVLLCSIFGDCPINLSIKAREEESNQQRRRRGRGKGGSSR